MKLIFAAGVLVGAVLGMPIGSLVGWPADDADANTFHAHLQSHGTFIGTNSPAKNLSAGMFACSALHDGQTPDQIVASAGFATTDVPGIIDAAQSC